MTIISITHDDSVVVLLCCCFVSSSDIASDIDYYVALPLLEFEFWIFVVLAFKDAMEAYTCLAKSE